MMHLILCKCVSVKFLSSLEGNGAQISVWAASDPLIYWLLKRPKKSGQTRVVVVCLIDHLTDASLR